MRWFSYQFLVPVECCWSVANFHSISSIVFIKNKTKKQNLSLPLTPHPPTSCSKEKLIEMFIKFHVIVQLFNAYKQLPRLLTWPSTFHDTTFQLTNSGQKPEIPNHQKRIKQNKRKQNIGNNNRQQHGQ